jgi:deoxyhypusine monooxygenase
MFERPPFAVLVKSLADPANPIGMRMRAAYFLRQAHAEQENQQEDVVKALSSGLLDERQGSLMRHEFAYVLGQLRDERCCETLEIVLAKDDDCIMVRHEAAEALGAIGACRSEAVLRQVKEANPDFPELSDTCQLALNVMEWRAAGGDPADMPAACACMLNPYSSVDPAPPHPAHVDKSFEELGEILCDADQAIFERYRAMFSLRNRGGDAAVLQLCRALTTDTSSALLRHEVAYVLGQMQHPSSVEALAESLRRTDEHKMVRHESAEALGAIDGRWEDVEKILKEFTHDENQEVRESCLVALDAADYWGHSGNDGNDETVAQNQELDVPQSFSHQKNVLVNHFNVK